MSEFTAFIDWVPVKTIVVRISFSKRAGRCRTPASPRAAKAYYALNAQETGRNVLNARIDEASLRESDLLAFQIAIEIGDPASVMCAYNKIKDDFACENEFLLNQILRRDWSYKGWVMSDWGAVHSTTKAALASLDHQSGYKLDPKPWFGDILNSAIENGEVR